MISQELFNAKILPFTLKWESGYVNSPTTDKGGETYRGITRKNHPSWSGWKVVDSKKPLKKGQIIPELENSAKELYFSEYFVKKGFNMLNSIKVAQSLFDFAVHGGYSASKLKAMTNDKFNTRLNITPSISFGDSIVLNQVNENNLTSAIMAMRNDHLAKVIANDPSQAVNASGWANRMTGLYSVLGIVKTNPIKTALIVIAVVVVAYLLFFKSKLKV